MNALKERNEDRLKKSIRGQKPDAHPFYLWINFPLVKSVTGVDLDSYFHQPEVMLETQVELISQLDACAALYPDFGVIPESSGFGGKVRFDGKGFISVQPSPNLEIGRLNDFRPADPYGDNYMRRCLETLKYMKTHIPSGFKLDPAKLIGPFTVGAQIFGIEDFCMTVYDDPDFIHEILEVVIETEICFMKEQEKILGGLDNILIADDIAAFLSEAQFREFVMPTYEHIFAEFPGVERRYHNDANALHLAGAIADAGFQLWHMGNMFSITDAAKKAENRLAICGDIVPTRFAELPPKEAGKICSSLLDKFDGNPRLVLSTGGYFSYGTPLENIRTLMCMADERKI
ncbi:MAG TPA: hypothetical protein DD738_10780 [Ruminiclostridium sp.]|nr:hypothetical protein [Ruminiclostridium sp.]